MKRRSRKAGSAVSARVTITEVTRNLDEAFARSDASALADTLFKRAIENGEPISPDLLQFVSQQSRGGAPSKLLKAIPAIRGSNKRAAKLRKDNLERQEKAAKDYQLYRKIAGELIAKDPRLRRATRHRLAPLVRNELNRRGREVVSIKTIERALKPPTAP